jgi:hypothetical protein
MRAIVLKGNSLRDNCKKREGHLLNVEIFAIPKTQRWQIGLIDCHFKFFHYIFIITNHREILVKKRSFALSSFSGLQPTNYTSFPVSDVGFCKEFIQENAFIGRTYISLFSKQFFIIPI